MMCRYCGGEFRRLDAILAHVTEAREATLVAAADADAEAVSPEVVRMRETDVMDALRALAEALR